MDINAYYLKLGLGHEDDFLAIRRPAWNIDGNLPAIDIGYDFRGSAFIGYDAQQTMFIERVIARVNLLRK